VKQLHLRMKYVKHGSMTLIPHFSSSSNYQLQCYLGFLCGTDFEFIQNFTAPRFQDYCTEITVFSDSEVLESAREYDNVFSGSRRKRKMRLANKMFRQHMKPQIQVLIGWFVGNLETISNTYPILQKLLDLARKSSRDQNLTILLPVCCNC